MSRGRHSRPRARGGGLASLLAIALAGGAVAIGLTSPSTATLRLCVIGGAAVGAVGLLLLARLQRVSTRAQARTEDRLRALEQRSREESAELHRRVIEAVTREGELHTAVDLLSSEISRLRGALDGLMAPVGAAVATLAERSMPAAPTYDLPLVQRAFADETQPDRVLETPLVAAAASAAAEPPAGDLWQPAQRPQSVPVVAPAAAPMAPAAAAAAASAPADVRSWVVRELDVSDDSEPVAALTMRILDLRTPLRVDEEDDAEPVEVGSGWTSFARPA